MKIPPPEEYQTGKSYISFLLHSYPKLSSFIDEAHGNLLVTFGPDYSAHDLYEKLLEVLPGDELSLEYGDLKQRVVERVRSVLTAQKFFAFSQGAFLSLSFRDEDDVRDRVVLCQAETVFPNKVDVRLFVYEQRLFGGYHYVPSKEHKEISLDLLPLECLLYILRETDKNAQSGIGR
jgi:hypothetical protein